MMYNVMPYRRHNDVMNRHPFDVMNDVFFRSFFNMTDYMGNIGMKVSVRDENERYVLEAELPGVKQENIELNVDNDVLTIAAVVRSEHTSEQPYYSERREGRAERRFNLKGIRKDEITAEYENGVLSVYLPKEQNEEGVKKIQINSKNKAENV